MALSYSVFKAKFKKTIADAIFQEITSKTARYYHWFGKENSWMDFLSPFIPSNPTADAPGEPSDNFRYDLHVRRDILTAKLIKPSDVSYIVRRIDWENDTVYDMYDDAYDKTSGYGYGPAYSGATRLEDSNFYVLTSEYNVYKCIWNAEDTPSTVMPTGTTVDVFTTADGYKWKFMYTIPVGLRNRFLTSEYMPVTTALNEQYYSNGAISNIIIENGGSGYNPSTTTATITGDGYTESNPYKLSDIVLQKTTSAGVAITKGFGYSTTPLITISSPYPTATPWTALKAVAVGSYISYYNSAEDKTNFYKVITGTQLGTSGPIHDDPTNPTQSQSGGNCQLKYVGTQAVAAATLDTNPLSATYSTITEVAFTNSAVDPGYGYLGAPSVTIDPPVIADSQWSMELEVAINDIIQYGDNYYQVSAVAGDSKLGVSPPTHTAGTEVNGDVDLDYIATNANVELVVTKNEAEIDLLITPGTDSVFTVNISGANPGTQYVEAPTVTLSAPPVGNLALASISSTGVQNGSIISISVDDPGNGYLEAPTVTISPPHITIDPTDPLVVNSLTGVINYSGHKLLQNDTVTYQSGTGTPIDGLISGDILANEIVASSVYRVLTNGTTDWLAVGADSTAEVTAGISGTVMTVTDITSGELFVGQFISGSGVTPATYIVEQLTSDEVDDSYGAKGTYRVSSSQTVSVGTTIYGQPQIGDIFTSDGVGTGTGRVEVVYYIIYVDENNFKLAKNLADATSSTHIVLDDSVATDTNHRFELTSGAAVATAALGSGGEIVGYTIIDGGVGYTNCNITIVDTSQPSYDGGAVLVANFAVGDVDSVQANVELLAINGSIEAIKVVDGGSGYGAATINILGDGTGATARAICAGGRVTAVEIVTAGQGYTWTDVKIVGNAGSTGAAARAIMSPIGGHGYNAIDELNANSLVFYTSISRDKNQGIEITNNDYHKVGLVRNIKQFGSNVRFTEDVGSGCVLITGYTIGNPTEEIDTTKLEPDMLLYKDETPDNDDLAYDDLDYKKYRIVEYNSSQILLSVFNNFTITEGDVLRTDPSNIGRVALADQLPRSRIKVTQVSERTIDQFSGDFLFFSVREAYAPTADQIITVRTTLTL